MAGRTSSQYRSAMSFSSRQERIVKRKLKSEKFPSEGSQFLDNTCSNIMPSIFIGVILCCVARKAGRSNEKRFWSWGTSFTLHDAVENANFDREEKGGADEGGAR